MNKIIEEIDATPTFYHVISHSNCVLESSGYVDITGRCDLQNLPDNFYFFTKSGDLVAFNAHDYDTGTVFVAKGDSPGFYVKQNSQTVKNNCEQIELLPYGDALYFAWLDRDLTIAGRVLFKKEGEVLTKLVHLKNTMMEIPSIAAHLSKNSIKTDFKIDKHFKPILSVCLNDECKEQTLLRLIAEECKCSVEDIINYNLFAISAENASRVGINSDFLNSQRIDGSIAPLIGLKNFVSLPKQKTGFKAFCIYKQYGIYGKQNQGSEILSKIFNKIHIRNTKNVSLVILENLPSTSPNHSNEINNIPLGSGIYFISYQQFLTNNHLYKKAKEILKEKSTKNNFYHIKPKDDLIYNVVLSNNPNTFSGAFSQVGDIIRVGFPVIGYHSIRETCFIPDIEEYNRSLNLLFNFL